MNATAMLKDSLAITLVIALGIAFGCGIGWYAWVSWYVPGFK